MNEKINWAERKSTPHEMTQEDLLELLGVFESEDIDIWIDGGWGVDVLLGRQTRRHRDVDIVISEKEVSKARTILEDRGFRELASGEEWNFVMADSKGRAIDFHVVSFDEGGNGLYAPPERSIAPYPASSFTSKGILGDREIRCLSADYQMISHTGYEADDDDRHDVRLLHEELGISLPDEYFGYPG